jgi:hypothetical protein
MYMPQGTLEDMFFAVSTPSFAMLAQRQGQSISWFCPVLSEVPTSAGAARPGADIDSLDCWDLD